MKNFFSRRIQFSGNSIKSCVGLIDLIDSTKNTIRMDGSESIQKYYSTFINYVSDSIKNSGGKVIKNILVIDRYKNYNNDVFQRRIKLQL